MTIPQFTGLLLHIANALPAARHKALEYAAQIVEEEAKDVIGTYRYRWVELAEATKEDRLRLGFSENEPGLRTGDMRESITHIVQGNVAHIGSDDDKLVWFELGTVKQPPRPVLKGAVLAKVKEIEHVIGHTMHAVLSSGKVPSSSGLPFNPHSETVL